MRAQSTIWALSLFAALSSAHLVPWHPGMYCFDGVNDGQDPNNAQNAVKPLYQLDKSDWWMHHVDKCDEFPPAEGQFLELPAGQSFQVEIAANKGKTSFSFKGKFSSLWGDGNDHPDDYHDPNCISSPLLHTQNYSMVAGSAFAIAYTSDLKAVTEDNLVVFTVNTKSPWKRFTSYQVPADMPACPEGGCICAWGWIPNGCGQPNMYQVPYRCKVTGAKSTKAVGQGKPAVWCEDDSSKCVKGPKQMLYWHQNNGNNIEVTGWDKHGAPKSPAYNPKCGFADGAQNDIFTGGDSGSSNGNSGSSGSSSGSSSSSPKPAPSSSAPKPAPSSQASQPSSTPQPDAGSELAGESKDSSSSSSSSTPKEKKCIKKRNVPRATYEKKMKRSAYHGHAKRNAAHSF